MKLTYITILFLLGLFFGQSLWAQRAAKRMTIGKMRDMSRDVGSSAGDLAKEEMQSYEAGARSNIQGLKKDLPGRALGFLTASDSNPKLAELIEDEGAKADIEDRRNKKRFVTLLYEWWMLPSDVDLAEKRRRMLELLKNKIAPKAGYLHQKKVNGEEVIVFTWHPTWYDKAYKQYHYDRVNFVSYYSYDIDPYSGEPLNPEAITDFLAGGFVAHVKGTPRIKSYGTDKSTPPDTSFSKVLLSLSLHGEENTTAFLSGDNMNAQQIVIDGVIKLLDSVKADGIELNILGVPASMRGELNKFLRNISQRVHNSRPDRYVFLSMPPFDRQGVYDFRDLTEYIDYFIILALDFHNEVEEGRVKKGPVSPLNLLTADQTPDIRMSVERMIRKIGTYNASRLILALPNYGTMWMSQSPEEVFVKRYSYDDIMTNYILSPDTVKRDSIDRARYGMIWKLIDATDTMSLPIRTEIYFDDVATLRTKYAYALNARLGGVALHMLGDVVQYNEEYKVLLDEVFAEYVEPNTNMFAKVDKASSTSQNLGIYFLAVLLYWGIFMVCGFVWALFDYKTRQSLFEGARFRTMYLAFFVALLIMLGNYFGLFQYNVALLIAGLVLGSFLSWSILKSIYKQQAEQP
jgi:hypothetical protein